MQVDPASLILLKARDLDFLNVLFENTNPYLFKLLASNRVYGEEAEDLLQAAWETFFKNIDQFKGESQIKVFLAGIVINKIREHRRRIKKIVYEEDSEKIYEQAFDSEGWWNQAPADPQRLLESKQSMHSLDECLEGLSELQREAFILKIVENEKTEVICNILNVSVSHIGVLLYRAKDKLRQCLEGKSVYE